MSDPIIIALISIVSGAVTGLPAIILALRTNKKLNGYIESREEMASLRAEAKTAAAFVVEVAKETARDLATKRPATK